MRFNKILIMTMALVLGLSLNVKIIPDQSLDGLAIDVSIIEYAYARRGGGFSSRSVRVSSFKPSKPRASSTRSTTSRPKATPKVKPKTKSQTAFAAAGKRQQSRQAAATERQKFATKPTAAQTRSTYASARSTPLGSRMSNVDRRTYASRRSAETTRWASNSRVPQTVIYRSSPSFGMYDSLFMWHVVMGNPAFGYHHYRDPGYLQWRREADRLAADNADLRAQLATHDQGVSGMSGNRNAEYVPDGVDADIIFAPAMIAAALPEVRLCTGRTDGKYFEAGAAFDKLVANSDVTLVATAGSVQNLQMLKDGKCDAAFVQRDAYLVFDASNPNSDFGLSRLGSTYNEDVHLFCSTNSDVDHLEGLLDNTTTQLYVGEAGSGASVTWANMVTVQDRLAGIKVVNKSPTDASFGADNHCGIYVGKTGSGLMTAISKKPVRLLDIETIPVDEVMDPSGKAVYAIHEIAEDTYTIQRGWNDSGMWTETPTLAVPTDFVFSDTWKTSTLNSTAIMTEYLDLKTAVVESL